MSDTTNAGASVPATQLATTELRPADATPIARHFDGRFAPGQSGNPLGRARGTRPRTTIAIDSLLDGEAEALSGKLVALALSGDTAALRMCIERLAPRPKSRLMQFELPAIEKPTDIGAAMSAILAATANGEVEIDQAERMIGMLESRQRNFDSVDIENRVSLIERKVSRDSRAI